MTSIVQAAHYGTENARIAEHPITVAMFDTLPDSIRTDLADGVFISGFMLLARTEWHRRAAAADVPRSEYPASIGTTFNALALIAKQHAAAAAG